MKQEKKIEMFSGAVFERTHAEIAQEYTRAAGNGLENKAVIMLASGDYYDHHFMPVEGMDIVVVIAPGAAVVISYISSQFSSVDYIVARDAVLIFINRGTENNVFRFFALQEGEIDCSFLRTTSAKLVLKLYGCGQKSRIIVRGSYLLHKDEQIFIEVEQQHLQKEVETDVLFKGIITDKARVDFKGNIAIPSQGSKAQASLYNKNIVLSATARVVSKPQLEVTAHDVQCKHGSAVSYVDTYATMYLQSRGISEKVAYRLLLESFINECVQERSEQKAAAMERLNAIIGEKE